jgi:alpha-2-macroglobulin
LVLISPLTLETQEIAESGRVRVNVLNQVQGGYRANVHVKVIGSENESFISGETDLRGLFVADGIRGVPTIIARENDAHYAFHRSARRLVHAQDQSGRVASPSGSSVVPDYLYNLRSENAAMQKMNRERLDAQRRNRQQGVQVQYAF